MLTARSLVALAALLLGCAGPRLSPTTLFYAPIAGEALASDEDWARLVRAVPGEWARQLEALAPIGEGAWVVWASDGEERGLIARVQRTPVGLEAQSLGLHVGRAVRPTVRALRVGDALLVILESSRDAGSTERDAFVYVERRSEIVPASIDSGAGSLRVRAQRSSSLGGGWSREATLTVTLEASDGALVVHEHESVREIAADRPELSARSTYDVERARAFSCRGIALTSDRPSLFDDDVDAATQRAAR